MELCTEQGAHMKVNPLKEHYSEKDMDSFNAEYF